MDTLLLIIIVLILLMLLLSSGKKKFIDYFEQNKLPDGRKVSIIKWTEISIFSSAAVAVLSGLITRDVLQTIGWVFITLFMVSYGGPYMEYAIAWLKEPNKPIK